jgi:SAM-dependent methyltransferase
MGTSVTTGGTEPSRLGLGKPSGARMYDYALGGKDNYQIDRDAADKVLSIYPGWHVSVRENRLFMRRAITELAGMGVTQFLDIGTGIPTVPNLHQVAQAVRPEARVVYVDNDPIVLAHARALLVGTPEGRTAYIDADMTDPAAILSDPALTDTLDLGRPVALSLLAVLHFLSDDSGPYELVETLLDALAPGSFLLISHATADIDPETIGRAMAAYRESGVGGRTRSRAEVGRFFTGLELLEPGVVLSHRWRPVVPTWESQDPLVSCWVGVARK